MRVAAERRAISNASRPYRTSIFRMRAEREDDRKVFGSYSSSRS
jgi:hypothetical protein